MLCEDCPKRNECTEPCEELKKELDKVTFGGSESPFAFIKMRRKDLRSGEFLDGLDYDYGDADFVPDENMDPWKHGAMPKGRYRGKTIVALRVQGLSYAEIQYHVGCSRGYISTVCRKRIALAQNEEEREVLKLRLSGATPIQIVEKTDMDIERIRYICKKYQVID